jgi:hypothetical protein
LRGKENVCLFVSAGENIADLGGLRLAYRALRAQPGFDDTNLIGGFTPTQRFFLAWGTAWRQNIGKERALQLVTLDPHGPNEFRCNGPLSNIPVRKRRHLSFCLRHLYIQTNILPGQARDKHREKLKKECRFSQEFIEAFGAIRQTPRKEKKRKENPFMHGLSHDFLIDDGASQV